MFFIISVRLLLDNLLIKLIKRKNTPTTNFFSLSRNDSLLLKQALTPELNSSGNRSVGCPRSAHLDSE